MCLATCYFVCSVVLIVFVICSGLGCGLFTLNLVFGYGYPAGVVDCVVLLGLLLL